MQLQTLLLVVIVVGATGFAASGAGWMPDTPPSPPQPPAFPLATTVQITGDRLEGARLSPLEELPDELPPDQQAVCSGRPPCSGCTSSTCQMRRLLVAHPTSLDSLKSSCCVSCKSSDATFELTKECRRKRRRLDPTFITAKQTSCDSAGNDPTDFDVPIQPISELLGAAPSPTIFCSNSTSEMAAWAAANAGPTEPPIKVTSAPTATAVIVEAERLGLVAAICHVEAEDGSNYCHMPRGARLFSAINDLIEKLLVLCHAGHATYPGGDPTETVTFPVGELQAQSIKLTELDADFTIDLGGQMDSDGSERALPPAANTSTCHALRVGSTVWLEKPPKLVGGGLGNSFG